MQQKRITAIYITLLLICAIVLGCVVAINKNDTPSGESSTADFSQSAASSTDGGSSDAELSSQDEPSQSEESQPEPSQPPEESSEPPKNTVVSFLACPDNIIHPSVYYDALIRAAEKAGKSPEYSKLQSADFDFASIYENVAEAIKTADLSYINVETLIGGNQNPISGYPTFNTPEKAGHTLCDLGFDVFNLAHNHMLDSYNDKYLINCNSFFEGLGKTTIGYYKNKDEIDNIKIVEVNGIKIAFLAYTFSTNGISLQAGAQTYIPYFDEALIDRQVALAKSNADFIIASCHWGNEDSYTPTSHQKKYADYLISKNVDVVLGMHPHVIQPMEWRDRPDGGKTLLVYSLGNFVSGMQDGFNMLGGMLSFDIVKTPSGDVYAENVIFDPIVTHYEPGKKVNSDDTGYRKFKIYYLRDYTDELASRHNVPIWDKTHTPTLVGGTFCRENLFKTVAKYIPAEFLREEYRG